MQDSYEDRVLFLKIFNAYKAKKRDAALEQEILALNDPAAACLYAIHVVKGEWEAAEPIIGKVTALRRYRSSINSSEFLPKFPNASGKLIIRAKNKRRAEFSVDVNSDDFCNITNRHGIISNSLVSHAYFKLTGKRLKSIEDNTKSLIKNRWQANRVMSYVKLVYEKTGEVIDFENGLVAVKIIEQIKNNEFSKNPIPNQDKERIIKELEQRMALYSFVGIQESTHVVRRGRSMLKASSTPIGAIKAYFETRVEAMNELFKILSEHDENMTIKELKNVLRNNVA